MGIANAEAEQEMRELADTQAALRRLATLVARGEPPQARSLMTGKGARSRPPCEHPSGTLRRAAR